MFPIGTPSNNLNTTNMNLKNEKLTKKQWSMKRSKLEPRGQRPLQHEHIPLLALNLNSNENNGTPNGKKGTRLPKEKHNLNKGGPMVKQLLRLVHATNALPKVLPNHPKETSLTKS
jgi:hypothetical protein